MWRTEFAVFGLFKEEADSETTANIVVNFAASRMWARSVRDIPAGANIRKELRC